MIKRFFFTFLCIVGSFFFFSCKGKMATEVSSTQTFQVDSSGDIVFNVHTGDSIVQYIKIINLMSDSLTLTLSIDGSTFFNTGSKIRISPKDSLSYSITYFPQRQGDDTATLTIRSALGDTHRQRLIGHANGPRYDHSILYLTLDILLSVIDSSKDSTFISYSPKSHDTVVNEFFSDGISSLGSGRSQTSGSGKTQYLGSGVSQTRDTISYSYSSYYNNDRGSSGDGTQSSVNIYVVLDTTSQVAKDVIFEKDDNNHSWYGSHNKSGSEIRYGIHLKNVPYIRSSDGSLDILILGNSLSQSLISFEYMSTSENATPNEFHSTEDKKHALFPQANNVQIHINLRN